MSEQGGAVVVCIFITEGECVRSVWVLVGSIGWLGLGESDGGRMREGQRDVLLKRTGLLHALNNVGQDF
jgi:hypothetical protein